MRGERQTSFAFSSLCLQVKKIQNIPDYCEIRLTFKVFTTLLTAPLPLPRVTFPKTLKQRSFQAARKESVKGRERELLIPPDAGVFPLPAQSTTRSTMSSPESAAAGTSSTCTASCGPRWCSTSSACSWESSRPPSSERTRTWWVLHFRGVVERRQRDRRVPRTPS